MAVLTTTRSTLPTEQGHRIRIIVFPNPPEFYNAGDTAMLQTTVSRFQELWPDAVIQVRTSDPDGLQRHCPNTEPLPSKELLTGMARRSHLGRLSPLFPWLASGLHRAARLEVRLGCKVKGTKVPGQEAFLGEIRRADLAVVSGMGVLTDCFKYSANQVLSFLASAIQCGVPAVALGQGIGPVQDEGLSARMQTVLPQLALIALRESRAGLPLLRGLGVPRSRIIVTGDDAIELAFRRRTVEIGNGLGVNIRVGPSSEMDNETVGTIRDVILDVTQEIGAPMIPVVINQHSSCSDKDTVHSLFAAYQGLWRGKLQQSQPAEVIRDASRCRLVVTGSYHGAVFALSQGIPSVCFAKSRYYADKFLGLREQFGVGCTVLLLDKCVDTEQFRQTILNSWESATHVRPSLLAAAQRQIEKSRQVYRSLERFITKETASRQVPLEEVTPGGSDE